MSKSKENEIAKEISSKTITLKDRFAIVKLISNTSKIRVLLVAKIFEPELCVDITQFCDERCLQDSVLLHQYEPIEILLDFIERYSQNQGLEEDILTVEDHLMFIITKKIYAQLSSSRYRNMGVLR